MSTPAARGVGEQELALRIQAAQSRMADAGLSALLLTTEPEIRYYTGFLTRFWESPTRPWFVILPPKGAPIAVIPAIGAHLMMQTGVQDIRTWQAPDYEDDGIGLLVDALCDVTPLRGRIGIADQIESHVRLPLGDLRRLETRLAPRALVGDMGITRRLRSIKSDSEIAKIRHAAGLASRAFDRVPEIADAGRPLSRVFRDFQALCLDEGADWVPYLAGAAAPGGYADVISPATDTPLALGDVLMLDTGLVWDGYFCDFNRNYSIAQPSSAVQRAHGRLIAATEAGILAAKPGATMADLFATMHAITDPDGAPHHSGRFGHGLGMQLTEGASILPTDHTILRPGMVITLEPSLDLGAGKLMVHEENIVINEAGAEYLSVPQHRDIRVL